MSGPRFFASGFGVIKRAPQTRLLVASPLAFSSCRLVSEILCLPEGKPRGTIADRAFAESHPVSTATRLSALDEEDMIVDAMLHRAASLRIVEAGVRLGALGCLPYPLAGLR